MIEAMKNDLNTKFEKWYKAGKVNLLAASNWHRRKLQKSGRATDS